ncbi:hypothetical protein, partial [Sulfuricurvum sp.]|uniref:hypothetical protein n=1 Tax=Sulfuricurvum sp. TaxID=2025608 RepID=UPI002601BE24
IGFESYCDFNRTTCAQFFGNWIALTGEDTNWYKNIDHNLSIYGNGDLDGIITQKNGAGNVNINDITNQVAGVNFSGETIGFQRYGASYNGGQGYPYRATMQNVPEGWLVYNISNPTPLGSFNEFGLEFNKEGAWVGKSETETATDSNAAANSNRRTMW